METIIFNEVRKLWPDELDLDKVNVDVDVDVDNASKLFAVYESVEIGIDDDDEWLLLASWAFHQALFNKKLRGSKDRTILYPKQVSVEKFEFFMKKNLANENWDDFRPLYKPSC